jgi:hypothetical protein
MAATILVQFVLISTFSGLERVGAVDTEEGATPGADSASVWGEYVDRVNGFSIGYPFDCRYIEVLGPMTDKEMEARERARLLRFGDVMRLATVKFTNWSAPVFCVNVFDNPSRLSSQEFALKETLASGIYRESEIKTEDLTVGRDPGIKLVYRSKVGAYNGVMTPVYIRKQDKIFQLILFWPVTVNGKTYSYEELFEELVATFVVF